jgi:hypothetical protein
MASPWGIEWRWRRWPTGGGVGGGSGGGRTMASGDDGAGSGDNTLMDGRGRWHRLWRMASVDVREL